MRGREIAQVLIVGFAAAVVMVVVMMLVVVVVLVVVSNVGAFDCWSSTCSCSGGWLGSLFLLRSRCSCGGHHLRQVVVEARAQTR